VTVEMVVRTLRANTTLAQNSLIELLTRLTPERPCTCKDALHDALITDRDHIAPQTLKRLKPLVQRYLV